MPLVAGLLLIAVAQATDTATTVSDDSAVATCRARYVFATLNQTQLALLARLDWTFTSRLSFQLFLQPLIASAQFINLKELARPRSFDFVVYGRDRGGRYDRSGGRRRGVLRGESGLQLQVAAGQRGAALGVAAGLDAVRGVAAEPAGPSGFGL